MPGEDLPDCGVHDEETANEPLSWCLSVRMILHHFAKQGTCLQSTLASARQVRQGPNPAAGDTPRPFFALVLVAESSGRRRDCDSLAVLGFATCQPCIPRNGTYGPRVSRTCRLMGTHATADRVTPNGNFRCRLVQSATASSVCGRDERMERTGL
jgi:hypothetical protein